MQINYLLTYLLTYVLLLQLPTAEERFARAHLPFICAVNESRSSVDRLPITTN